MCVCAGLIYECLGEELTGYFFACDDGQDLCFCNLYKRMDNTLMVAYDLEGFSIDSSDVDNIIANNLSCPPPDFDFTAGPDSSDAVFGVTTLTAVEGSTSLAAPSCF